MLQRPLVSKIIALLLLVIVSGFGLGIQAQITSKVACGPCGDYYGYDYGPGAQTLVIPDTVPGLYHFVHIEDPDTGTTYSYGSWGFLPDSISISSGPGDTVTIQYTQNGTFDVYMNAYYAVPTGMCIHWGHFLFTVSDFPIQAVTAAPEALTTALSTAPTAYPNPVQGILTVAWDHLDAAKTSVSLYNLSGQMLKNDLRFQQGKLQLDMQDLPAGVYELMLVGPKDVQHLRVVME